MIQQTYELVDFTLSALKCSINTIITPTPIYGDNVTPPSTSMLWYCGCWLLPYPEFPPVNPLAQSCQVCISFDWQSSLSQYGRASQFNQTTDSDWQRKTFTWDSSTLHRTRVGVGAASEGFKLECALGSLAPKWLHLLQAMNPDLSSPWRWFLLYSGHVVVFLSGPVFGNEPTHVADTTLVTWYFLTPQEATECRT